jgi:hypothetical protein
MTRPLRRRIASVHNVHKLHALHHPPRMDVEARNNPLRDHWPQSSRRIFMENEVVILSEV